MECSICCKEGTIDFILEYFTPAKGVDYLCKSCHDWQENYNVPSNCTVCGIDFRMCQLGAFGSFLEKYICVDCHKWSMKTLLIDYEPIGTGV